MSGWGPSPRPVFATPCRAPPWPGTPSRSRAVRCCRSFWAPPLSSLPPRPLRRPLRSSTRVWRLPAAPSPPLLRVPLTRNHNHRHPPTPTPTPTPPPHGCPLAQRLCRLPLPLPLPLYLPRSPLCCLCARSGTSTPSWLRWWRPCARAAASAPPTSTQRRCSWKRRSASSSSLKSSTHSDAKSVLLCSPLLCPLSLLCSVLPLSSPLLRSALSLSSPLLCPLSSPLRPPLLAWS